MGKPDFYDGDGVWEVQYEESMKEVLARLDRSKPPITELRSAIQCNAGEE